MRTRILRRLAPFIHVISVDLPKTYNLILQGSWAHGEFHAIEEDRYICSYSDVDFICSASLSQNQKMTIENKIYESAVLCSLRWQGVSIRQLEDMNEMWTLQGCGHTKLQYEELQREFILFWTLIGAAEVCAALPLNQGCSSYHKRHYHLNKFFLNLWRDFGIATGNRFGSYLETLKFISRYLASNICNNSYAIKLGTGVSVPWDVLESAHQSSILNQLRLFMQSTEQYYCIQSIVHDLLQINSNTASLLVFELLGYAKKFDGNLPTRKSVIDRLFHKLEPVLR